MTIRFAVEHELDFRICQDRNVEANFTIIEAQFVVAVFTDYGAGL